MTQKMTVCAPPGSIAAIADPRERLLAFARERHAIYLRKLKGWPGGVEQVVNSVGPSTPVWTTDPILREYRFCNVYRENDTVTKWIADNWRTPHADDPDLWFAMVVARFVNWPETLEQIEYPVPWRRHIFMQVMHGRKKAGLKVWTGAYVVRAESTWSEDRRGDKAMYQAEVVFSPMWEKREQLRPRAGDTLNSYHMLLGQWHGLGSFMAAQVIADLKYVEPLRSAHDWMLFAASGPGSRRGLNRVLGLPRDNPWREDEWRLANERLQNWFNERWEWGPLCGQDMQNVLCEWDKHERVRLGEGRPRVKYHS